ncbi:GntR family transcriptional regulator [Vreelandella glaciei]|uniref:GntR family transcriptional regulator n=1 Tax=Vreelandella glaciei TaxID=186761 RepID=UPI0030013FC1
MVNMNKIISNSLTSEALNRVVASITSGEYEPGQKISESQLARQLGISRGPIREALHSLEGRLVLRTPRKGVQVIKFGKDELSQLFCLREALEGMTARLAAENASDKWIDGLRTMLKLHSNSIEEAKNQVYLQPTADEDFHFSVINAAACTKLKNLLLNEVYYQLRIHRLRSSQQPGRTEKALKEHFDIVEQLSLRNPRGAEEAMRAHIRSARESTIAML